MTTANNLWRGRFLRYAPLVFWIGLILFLGSGQGALQQTSRFIRPFLEFLFPAASEETLQLIHSYIRKSAHVFEYALLAFFSARAFQTSSRKFLYANWFIAALSIVVSIAIIDEILQSYNPLRTGTPYDVLLDITGGICVLLVIAIFRRASPSA